MVILPTCSYYFHLYANLVNIYSIILKNNEGNSMFQKIAPLIVLALFAVGVYFMLQGMQGAMDMADPEKMKAKEETKK